MIVGPAGARDEPLPRGGRRPRRWPASYTPDVTEIYSPNATWPAVREALQGASLVIYMGHGNGWPSSTATACTRPPRTASASTRPRPATTTGTSTSARGRSRRRPPGQERGRPAQPPVLRVGQHGARPRRRHPRQARQRVDNFAAGFIKAGAAAVIAEAYASPNYMVRVVLGGQRSIESAWRRAPSANGNGSPSRARAAPATSPRWIPSAPTPGSRARSSSRPAWPPRTSCAAPAGAPSRGSTRRSTPRRSSRAWPAPASSSPPRSSRARPRPTGKIRFKIPFTIADREKLPTALQASARWDLIEPAAADPGAEVDARSRRPARRSRRSSRPTSG